VVLVSLVAEVEESEMVSQEFVTSVAFVRPAGVKTSPSDGPMMAIVLGSGWGAVGFDLMLEPTRTSSNFQRLN
jgi:hypothetical protein